MMTEQEIQRDAQYDTLIMEWTTLPREERLRRATIYQQQYPMDTYIFQYQKYIDKGMDVLGAYLKWIWLDKGL